MKQTSLEAVLPLSPLQEGMLFHALYDDGEGVDFYHMQTPLEIAGDVDTALLRRCAEAVVRRHPSLRAAFLQRRSGEPIQAVARAAVPAFAEIDFEHVAGAEQHAHLERALAADRTARFDMTSPPLIRFTLVRLAADRHVLVITNQHILLDGWSLPIVIRDLFRLYRRGGDPAELEPAVPAADYLGWLSQQDQGRAERIWHAALAGLDGPTLVAPGVATEAPERQRLVRRELPADTTAALVAAARDRGVTVNSVVQGCWALLLNLLTGRRDVVFGGTVAGRPAEVPGIDRVVGMLINTIPVRVRIDPDESLGALLGRLQDEQAALSDVQHLGLRDIQRLDGRTELFDTTVSFENYPIDPSVSATAVPGLTITLRQDPAGDTREGTHYPLSLAVYPGPRLRLELNYRPDAFGPELAGALADRMVLLLRAAVTAADRPVGTIDLLTAGERDTVLCHWNDTQRPRSAETLPDLFEAQVRRTPGTVAVVADGERLTFAELNTRANRLARALVARGAGPESFVGMALPRDAGTVVAILAILKAGAAYVPIDLDHPPARIEEVCKQAGPTVVLTTRACAGRLPGGGAPLMLLDELGDSPWPARDLTDADRLRPLRAANLAYVIYTSGSSGRPKGVAVEHRSLANVFHSHHSKFFRPETNRDGGRVFRVALTNALVFDASWSQVLWMVAGHELHIIGDEVRKDPHALVGYAAREAIDVIDTTPSFARQLLAADLMRVPGYRLRTLALGGEAVDDALWQQLREGDTSVYNLYGPAECTVDAMYGRVPESARPVVGRPADNTQAYVLDDRLRPLPWGITGEIYLAGAGLARGYLNEPAMTGERFVADPFGHPGDRMYRTGDRGAWQSDGNLVFAGRADDQVKIRGFRIEPGEVESVLLRDATVGQAAVMVREDRPGVRRLVAYLVPAGGTAVDTAAVLRAAGAALPDYMTPSAVMVLAALPLTGNGKLDRTALPAPQEAARGEMQPPTNDRERLLCDLFQELLGTPTGIDEDFFDIGGDSILSMQLAGRARRAGLELSPRDVFVHRTVAALATAARDHAPQVSRPAPAGPLLELTDGEREELAVRCAAPLTDVLPLTPLQAGMQFHALLAPDGIDVYNTQRPLEITGDLSPARLRQAFRDLLDRHDSVRAGFVQLDSGRSVQIVPQAAELPWIEVDLSDADPVRQRVRLDELIAGDRIRRFDLAAPPLLRVTLVRLALQRHLLLVTHHHILLDGWSLPILFRDLFDLYPATADAVPPVVTGFRDYLHWLSGQDKPAAVAAWTAALAGLDEPTLAAPGAEAADAVISNLVAERLGTDETARLHAAARAAGVTLNTVVQGAWAIVLSQLTGRRDVVFGATVAGRPAGLPGAEMIVGLLMNMVAVRVRLDLAQSLAAALERLQSEQAALIDHHHLGLADVQRAAGLGELFDTVVGFENTPLDGAAVRRPVPGLRIALAAGVAPGATHYPLSLVVVPGDELSLELNYRGDLFERDRVALLLGRLRQVLRAFVERPDIPVGGIALLSAGERDEAVQAAAVSVRGVEPVTVPELFERWVRRAPHAPAVLHAGGTITYAELNARANVLARELIRRGAGPESIVAIAVPKSPRTLVAMLAVLKAGGAYLPIDVGYPADRIAFMLGDARPDLVLTTRDAGVPALHRADGPAPLLIDELDADCADPGDPAVARRPDGAAYVIYTSGSTGRPKGVLVTHRGVASMLADQEEGLGLRPGGRVLLYASPSFDASVWEFCAALLTGACAVVAPADELLPGPPLARTVAAYGVTCLLLPPSSLAAVTDGDLPPGMALVVGGEACAPDLVARWSAGRTMVNAYGPTESTVMATMSAPLSGRVSPPLGRPITDTRVYLLDDALRPVPDGVIGELYLGGAGLARGYAGQPDVTAQRFVADPYGPPGGRLYRTGDLARRTPGGDREYLGRVDDQVKVRGFRIELGEIEATLTAHPGVHVAVVTVREDQPDVKRLVAYYVPTAGRSASAAALREHVAGTLPEYMVPNAYVAMNSLPTTPSGKLDRAALPAPGRDDPAGRREPRDDAERLLCRLVGELLGIDDVGIDDSFFELGGDSIASIQLVTRARKEGLVLAPRDVFTHRTVAELALAAAHAGAIPVITPPAAALVQLDADEHDQFIATWTE
ncbi:amino acid adenylation domain-containing protein [Dactylosporangium sp. NPDC000555]|uniref:amino acid adenylation domain-containing protein n=1 Tax=Dactylosporangium sp. NPDC000555 TaxID=3154260 RepID=UPI00331918E3